MRNTFPVLNFENSASAFLKINSSFIFSHYLSLLMVLQTVVHAGLWVQRVRWPTESILNARLHGRALTCPCNTSSTALKLVPVKVFKKYEQAPPCKSWYLCSRYTSFYRGRLLARLRYYNALTLNICRKTQIYFNLFVLF